eukprot:UN01753
MVGFKLVCCTSYKSQKMVKLTETRTTVTRNKVKKILVTSVITKTPVIKKRTAIQILVGNRKIQKRNQDLTT